MVAVKGRFDLIGNTFGGFDEAGSVVLGLYPDRFGQAPPNLYRGNIFAGCTNAVGESMKQLWDAARHD